MDGADTKTAHNGTTNQYPPSPPNQSRFFYMSPNSGLSRPSPRRSKRHVPDGEKDGKYWEKRKRNNDAARRSRENKRRLDMDARTRVLFLEENLKMARKELLVLKTKFRLPLDLRFLSTDDNGELVGQPIPVSSAPVTDDYRYDKIG